MGATREGSRGHQPDPKPAPRIDAHQHFWHYDSTQYGWMTEEMGRLRRDFLPSHLQPLLEAARFDGTITVQARQCIEETDWLLRLAGEHGFIRGVVGWVDLRSREVDRQLAAYASHPKLVGVRHVVHDEPDDGFLLLPEFTRGIARLRAFDLAYDLLLFPRHLPVAGRLVELFPEQRFVLDHIAKPSIRTGETSPWKEDLKLLARFPNVSCKLSGMITEARWGRWTASQLHRYLDIVVEAFGTDRLMIGSDWPVCLLSGDYCSTMRVVEEYLRQFPIEMQEGVLGANCASIYRIPELVPKSGVD